jgi:hypothetical protein
MSKIKSNPRSATVYLPQELYGRIFQFVFERSDLLALLYVSRAFRHEAERVLYETIDLAYHHARIYYWFKTITSSPHLAPLVKSLTFGIIYSSIPAPHLPWLQVIAKGLRTLTNLKEYVLSYRYWTTLKTNSQTELEQEELSIYSSFLRLDPQKYPIPAQDVSQRYVRS